MQRFMFEKIPYAVTTTVFQGLLFATTAVFGDTDYVRWEYTINQGKATIVDVKNSEAVSGDFEIPSVIEGCPVVAIGEFAFNCCWNLKTIWIPSTVEDIGRDPFMNCPKLCSIDVAFDNRFFKSVDGVLFDREMQKLIQCPAAKNGFYSIPSTVVTIGIDAFSSCDELEDIFIPDSVEEIHLYAFFGCAGLSRIEIPYGVRSIGCTAFNGCSKLLGIDVNSMNENYMSENGILYNKDKSSIVRYPNAKAGDFVIPSGVTSILEDAFATVHGLTKVTIPNSVHYIGNSAFNSCPNLTSVVLSENVSSIYWGTFAGCNSLTSVTIPLGVSYVGPAAFHCDLLDDVTFNGAPPEGIAEAGFNKNANIRYNRVFESQWLQTIETCGFTNATGFDPVLYVVTFDAKGGIVLEESRHVADGATIGTLPNAERDGYDFCGWYTEEEGGVQVSAARKVTADVTFYAHWQEQVIESTIYTVQFNANGGSCARASVEVKDGVAVGTLSTAARNGYDFLGWFTSPNGGTQISEATIVTEDVTWYAHWQENSSGGDDIGGGGSGGGGEIVVDTTTHTVTYNANGGMCGTATTEVEDGKEVGTLPTATRDGYDFLGWFTEPQCPCLLCCLGEQVSSETVVTGDVTWYAYWQKREDASDDDEPMDASVANTYDGVILDADGLPMGYISVKAAKASGKGDAKVSKVTATIQMSGEAKKVTVKASVPVAEAAFTQSATDGRVLDLSFSRNGIWGTFDGYEISGARNLLASTAKSDKGTDAKVAAEEAYASIKGNYVMAFEDDWGWNGLSVSVMAKGKVKVSGKLANGTSVSTTSQLIVGDENSVIPVIYTKKDTSLAFNIYFSNDGAEAEVFGYYDAVISSVSGLDSGLSFYAGDGMYDMFGDDYSLCDQFLPDGVSVEPSGKKWVVANGAKAGSIKLVDGEAVDTKESENPSGLKLTFNAKAGTFSGSFKVYALDSKDKLKTFTASVSGVVVDGFGYGIATIKKFGSCSIVITAQ